MLVSSMLTEEEICEYQNELYNYFSNGYDFEIFLKNYLIKMGLDEVHVTKKSRDGGIDLTAIRKGVGDFSNADITQYYIQAKRNHPSKKISPAKIRELKGTLFPGMKGMFITTSDFTSNAKLETNNDLSRPIVPINGKDLVISCIDNEIGFLYKPIFNKKEMDKFINKDKNKKYREMGDYITKTITSNDIRARIISIPSLILNKFTEDQLTMKVIVNDNKEYCFSINRGRNYFAKVSQFMKDYGLLSEEGIFEPKQIKWLYYEEKKIVKFYIEE